MKIITSKQGDNMQYLINDDATKWYSKKEICDVCKVGHSAFERFILILTNEDQKYIQKRPSRKGGHLYAEPILQKFQLYFNVNCILVFSHCFSLFLFFFFIILF